MSVPMAGWLAIAAPAEHGRRPAGDVAEV